MSPFAQSWNRHEAKRNCSEKQVDFVIQSSVFLHSATFGYLLISYQEKKDI